MDSSFLNKAKQTENGVIDLGLGEFSNKNSSSREILEFSVERALNQGVLYTDGFGSERLRKKIALYHNNIFSDITSYKNIGVTVGALHGLFLALSVLKPTLGEVILISPYFPPYLELFNNSGIKVKIYCDELTTPVIPKFNAIIATIHHKLKCAGLKIAKHPMNKKTAIPAQAPIRYESIPFVLLCNHIKNSKNKIPKKKPTLVETATSDGVNNNTKIIK